MDDLKKQFIDFNNAGNVPLEGFSKDDFKNHPKVKALIAIMRTAFEDVKKSASKVFEEFNVNFNITATDKIDEPYVNAVNFDFQNGADKQNLLLSVNFNFSKLATLPAPEVYTFVYHTMHSSLIEKRKSMPSANDYKFGKDVDLEEKSVENDQDFDRQGKYVKPKNTIVDYIMAFLRRLLGFKTKEELEQSAKEFMQNASLNTSYEDSAIDIAKRFADSGITQNDLFDNPPDLSNEEELLAPSKTLEEKDIPASGVEIEKKSAKPSNFIDGRVLDEALFASRYGSVVKQGNHQQATFLLGVFSKDEFNSLKNANETQYKAFCEKFARKFLENSGIDAGSCKITFNKFDRNGNERAAGTYIDYGSSQTININISQVMAIDNPAEVVMILAHELTHAVDSTVNKRKEKTTEEGYGLLNNTIGGTSGLSSVERNEDENVYNFVVELTETCYRLNPNEKSAREGELIAVEFMKGLNPDSKMQSYIDASINGYRKYQNAVVSDYEKLDDLMKRANAIKSQARTSATRSIIDARLNYLRQLKKNNLLNIKGVRESVKMAQQINEGEMTSEGLSIEQ